MSNDRMSEKSEKRLLNALEKVSNHMSSGETPNDAIVKVASEMDIPAGHVQLMVYAVNTGLANAHRESKEHVLDKSAAVDLADAGDILERLYPSSVKTASADKYDTTVSEAYAKTPAWVADLERHKVASVQIPTFKNTPKAPVVVDEYTATKKAFNQVQLNLMSVDAARLKVAEVREKTIKLSATLNEYFRIPGHESYTSVEENAVFAFGEQGKTVLNNLATDGRKFEKAASLHAKPFDVTKAPYTYINQAIKLAADFVDANKTYENTKTEATEKTAAVMRPFVSSPEQGHSVMADLSSPTEVLKPRSWRIFFNVWKTSAP